MLFIKILTQFTYPLLTSLLLASIGSVFLWHGRRHTGGVLLTVALSWLWLWSTPVFSDWLRAGLEQHVPPVSLEQIPSADAIVILGGAMEAARPPQRPHPNLGAAADRVWHAARLYHAGKAPLILASGGLLPWSGLEKPEAVVIRDFLQQLGVPTTAVLLETESRTTQENRDRSLPILREADTQRILLVTSALHMRRALMLFRNTDLEVIPAPTDFEIFPRDNAHPLRWLPDAEALENSSRAFKEYLGRLFYWITER